MPSTNQCIGSHYDELKQRVFYFNYNSSGYNGIYVYDVKTNAISPLLISYVDSAEDIFGFDPKYPIASVNILYRTEEEGDILHWTDRLNRPMKLNILEATVSGKTYGTNWKKSYLTVATKMPTTAPVCSYGDDANVSSNNLKSKLFQFSYRWTYKDGTKSCWSPWSKLFTPYNAESVVIESDLTKNNVISVTLKTGDINCSNIEISVRESVSSIFSDRMLVTVIDKAKKGISSNSLYVFNFYNDSIYTFLEIDESTQLFDYVPKKANAQEIVDDNILVYGGITEGNTFSGSLGITSAVTISETLNLMTIQSQVSGRNWMIKFFGTPVTGDFIQIDYTITKEDTNTGEITTLYSSFDYTVLSGNTLTDIRNAFKTNINADPELTAIDTSTDIGMIVGGELEDGFLKFVTATYTIVYVSGSSPVDVNISAYKHASTYKFGIVYFDEFGVTNGVITTDAMSINTPKLTSSHIGTDQINIPNIQFNINSLPPSWAKSFSFVRSTNLTTSDFQMIRSNICTYGNGVYKAGDYGYINISEHNTNKSGYPIYSFAKGDRVKIYGVVGQSTDSRYDLSIISTQTEHPGNSALPAGFWLKLPYNSELMLNWDTLTDSIRYMIEPYTPSYTSKDSDILYYEFGENYNIVTDANNNLVHQGQSSQQSFSYNASIVGPSSAPTATRYILEGVPQVGILTAGTYNYKILFESASGLSTPSPSASVTTAVNSYKINLTNIPLGPSGTISRKIYRTQVNGTVYKLLATISNNIDTVYIDNNADSSLGASISTSPAVFNFIRGDVYNRRRDADYIIDKSVSDKYDSKLDGNGRGFVIDTYAKEKYYPTTIRYSLKYEQNTNINNTNKFNDSNIDDYDRQKGDIQRLKTRGNQMRVFQSRACGVVPISQNALQTADGDSVVSQSSNVLNNIQYYLGEYGIGNQYCSLASSPQADYFTDPILGAQIRLSADGVTSLTETYKAHYYFNDKFVKYQKNVADKFGNGGYAKILGVYDVFEEQFTTCMQGSADSVNPITEMTFSFLEPKNCYSSFYDYYPEWICNAGNLIITWKNGELWTHNDTTNYANFYGVQYSPSIKIVFNDHQNIKKHYNAITTLGNTTWVSPTQGDIKTNLGQQSKLIQADFRIKDDKYHAAFKRDMLSSGGLLNGRVLKGSWIELNLLPVNPQNLVDLYYIDITTLEPLNNR